MPNVKQIVKEYLKENGYDGLAGDECGCGIENLFPCDCVTETCVAAHRRELSRDKYTPTNSKFYMVPGRKRGKK